MGASVTKDLYSSLTVNWGGGTGLGRFLGSCDRMVCGAVPGIGAGEE